MSVEIRSVQSMNVADQSVAHLKLFAGRIVVRILGVNTKEVRTAETEKLMQPIPK